MCIKPGQYILEIGCGTGYTTCLLAKKYGADVVAVEVRSKILELAKRRIIEEGVSEKVKIIEADAHRLPFSANTFDVVIVESVLAFCDKKKVTSEVYRVLKPNGVFGDNETTFLNPPPKQLVEFISESVSSETRLLQEDEWRTVFKEAEFVDVPSAVYAISFWGEFIGILRVRRSKIRLCFVSSIF